MTNMNIDINASTKQWTDLEEYLANSDDASFPMILPSEKENTKRYPDRYIDFKTWLGTEHDNVEYENTLASLDHKLNTLFSKSNIIDSRGIYDKIIVLNKHGKGHIELVIKCASNLIKCIKSNSCILSSFETFILLCAIQIHDIGNKYGREKHTTSFYSDFIKYADKSFINSGALKSCIFNIAKVHGGEIEGDKDTIEKAQLQRKTTVDNMDVRLQFLAAILRFSDELADDQTRAKKIYQMPEFSKVFHAYSNTLHTVRIDKNEINDTYFVKLCYYLNQKEAVKQYKKIDENGSIEEVRLLDEIFNRTIKMERERRYCSRYFLPYIQLTEIRVEIEIMFDSSHNNYLIQYTLPAKGYPVEDIYIPRRDEHISYITENASKEGENTNG